MPPSNFGERASIATAWHCVGSPICLAPWSSSTRSTRPMLYGVPRIRKLSAAGPHASLSQSMFDSNPPEAATSVRAPIFRSAPPFATVAE